MALLTRTVLSVMTAFGLLGSAALPTPSLAAVDPLTVTMTGSTVPLAGPVMAAITAPMLAFNDDALPEETPTAADAATAPRTLVALVEQHDTDDTVDAEQECLALSVYFEAKGEPLTGQLAVAETVLNRAGSGRFADSICGVVRQPGQFSFVHGGRLPAPARDSRAWRQAVAIARIAQAELWNDVAPDALYFHASRVRPNFGGKRIARLGNHVFYR